MKRLTADVDTLTVDSFATGLADQDCQSASAGATRTCPLDAITGAARP